MEQVRDYIDAFDALSWQVEMGAVDAIGDAPINRLQEPVSASPGAGVPGAGAASPSIKSHTPPPAEPAPVTAKTLDALRTALEAFEGCTLKRGARNTVFADGQAGARVMIVGEAPGRDEDRIGRPFVGRAGQLLDRMFAAIGLARDAQKPAEALYITNILPWRPPQNRDPSREEMEMMRPFLLRHIELAAPQILVTMGNPATKTLLETAQGISRLRGQWSEACGVPLLPMFHPAYLLRNPVAKGAAWADLLALRARLAGLPGA